jgi:hypothetical protein
VVFIDDILVYS